VKLRKYPRAGKGGVPREITGVRKLGKAIGFLGSVKIQNFGKK
jgi:hypothetical protein